MEPLTSEQSQHAHDYNLGIGPGSARDTLDSGEIERRIRADAEQTLQIARETPWLFGQGLERQVAWANRMIGESLAREAADRVAPCADVAMVAE